jgi:hypothetical protein
VILCAQIAETGQGAAIRAFGVQPAPATIEGMRFARSYLTADLRRGMLPSITITGAILFTAWDDDEAFDRFLHHRAAKPYRNGWQVRMTPARSVGLLPGLPELPRREVATSDLPVAAYTVGRVRAAKFLPFIKTAGSAEREAATHPGFLDGLTLFRPPLVIGTFSLWRNVRDMRHYAAGGYPGGHLRAINKDREQQFNHDMFFSRHIPYSAAGQWRGRNPLADLTLFSAVVPPGRTAENGRPTAVTPSRIKLPSMPPEDP